MLAEKILQPEKVGGCRFRIVDGYSPVSSVHTVAAFVEKFRIPASGISQSSVHFPVCNGQFALYSVQCTVGSVQLQQQAYARARIISTSSK